MKKRKLPTLNRIVVKIGSTGLCHENGKIDPKQIKKLTGEIADLIHQRIQVVLVSSGAVATGQNLLNETGSAIENKQAAAAIGQPILLATFQASFQSQNFNTAQILLTHDDLHDRSRYLSARNTMETLLDHGIIPIINENDTVSTEEIQFSDNDFLAALCTNLVNADLFIILSNINGIGEKDPNYYPNTDIFDSLTIDELTTLKETFPQKETNGFSRGGIITKLEAPIMAAQYGVPSIITNSRTNSVLQRIINGECLGTYIQPTETKLNSRKAYIAHALKPKAKLFLDNGAVHAIQSKKASLLPSGITKAEGSFQRGDGVVCCNSNSDVIARGIVEYDHDEIVKIAGYHSSDVESILGFRHRRGVIHRDNMVITKEN